VEVLGAYHWVPELQAGLLAEIDIAEVRAAAADAEQLSVGLSLGAALIALIAGLLIATRIARPIVALTNVAARIGSGDISQRATITDQNEIGVLAAGFNAMTDRLQQTLQGLELRVAERTTELRDALTEREQTLTELREAISAREALQATVRELSSPALPVLDGVLVMPLIGVIDSRRAALLTTTLLEAVEQHRAQVVILDVTGVPLVDTQVARTLIQAAEAARLLGARPVLVGIRPELAHTIVSLQLDLSAFVTLADLQSAIRYAAKQRGIDLSVRQSQPRA
jgi:anti-anti-sigma regulatory factor/HAMP domain-containing protein